jgi:hypothetical protein
MHFFPEMIKIQVLWFRVKVKNRSDSYTFAVFWLYRQENQGGKPCAPARQVDRIKRIFGGSLRKPCNL